MDEHFVQFYEADAFLVEEIFGFIGAGLRTGDAAIVIASKPHLEDIERRLRHGSSSSSQPSYAGRYIAFDAEQALSQIMVDGWPDENRFSDVIGGLIDSASDDGRLRVRAYGEMVTLLCLEGNQKAALRMEQLWNDLARRHSFSLLCSYPMHVFSMKEDDESFHHICAAHSHVRVAESFKLPTSEDDLRRAIAILQQKANALESEVGRRKEIEKALQRREKKLIELGEQLNKKLEELADVDRRKDEFLAMLGHELRNPLAPIMTSLELMRAHGNDMELIARSRNTIERQTVLMARLVDELLDVSRITRGTIELKKEPVTLQSIVERALEIANPLIDERQHHLALNLPAESVWLFGDPPRLAQMLANLLHNAAKYTDAGGSISITAYNKGNQLELIVCDNGIGLDAASCERIFDLFVQDTNSLARARGGLGLGLTLVRSLVRLHGGSVEARSAGLGRGSEFVVVLPLEASSEDSSRQSSNAVAPALPGIPRRILIVDDNVDAAESLGELLRTFGHAPHIVYDGISAIREADRLRPDVVILDIGLPAMDGYQVAQCLRSDVGLTSSLLVAVTGYAQECDRINAQQAGFDHHFAKPLDIRKLAAVLNSMQSPS